jgi:hypothetical protein
LGDLPSIPVMGCTRCISLNPGRTLPGSPCIVDFMGPHTSQGRDQVFLLTFPVQGRKSNTKRVVNSY